MRNRDLLLKEIDRLRDEINDYRRARVGILGTYVIMYLLEYAKYFVVNVLLATLLIIAFICVYTYFYLNERKAYKMYVELIHRNPMNEIDFSFIGGLIVMVILTILMLIT